jgi:hypothetical protein
MRLTNFGHLAKAHWKEHRPRMYRELEQSGQLEEALYAAQELTKDALANLLSQGVPDNQAWEAVRENWLLLPSEEQVPNLGENPASWIAPETAED